MATALPLAAVAYGFSPPASALPATVVESAGGQPTLSLSGVSTDAPGQVSAFGSAVPYGSPGVTTAPIVGIAATPSGHGYWLVGADGGVFSFGDASFYGSTGAAHLTAPIVGIAATPSGHGYWLVGADGGIFNFGDAAFNGSRPSSLGTGRVVGIAGDPSGSGYWLPTGSATDPSSSAAAAAASPVPSGQSLGTFMVTCYDLPGDTASGVPTSSETVAVDPAVIPLGSQIYVDGVGLRVAQDTGGAIIGHHIDIWEPTYSQCAQWGIEFRQVWLQS